MVIKFVRSKVTTKRGAEFGIAGLVSAADIATANNTISIIMSGPLAKNIADEYDVDPRKSASLLIYICRVLSRFLPYSPQVIAAAGVASISPFSVMPYCIYSFY